MTDTIHWGLLGLGSITRRFAKSLADVPDAEVYAVASRTQEKADSFGADIGANKCYGSYEALANDPDVDVIYIGTPHTYHMPNTLMCLDADKPVLCEKPFAVNRDQAAAMINRARKKKLFLMDAFWTRFLPATVKLRELLADEVIGDIMLLQVDFGFRVEKIAPEHRLFNPDLAGGALLDVGSYSVQLASMVFGKQPEEMVSLGTLGNTGVDELSATIFKYSDYEMATMTASIRLNTPQEARIVGTKGYISIPDWWHPTELTLNFEGKSPERLSFEFTGEGFNYQAAEVGRCLRAGLTESPVMPLDETLAIMDTLDRIRAIWGLRYPFED